MYVQHPGFGLARADADSRGSRTLACDVESGICERMKGLVAQWIFACIPNYRTSQTPSPPTSSVPTRASIGTDSDDEPCPRHQQLRLPISAVLRRASGMLAQKFQVINAQLVLARLAASHILMSAPGPEPDHHRRGLGRNLVSTDVRGLGPSSTNGSTATLQRQLFTPSRSAARCAFSGAIAPRRRARPTA
jgi:hypothetical protein